LVRVALTTGLGLVFALQVPAWLGLEARWGAAGLTLSAGLAAWVEMLLLRRQLNRRIGETGVPLAFLGRLWTAAAIAAAVAWTLRLTLPALPPLVTGFAILGPYGLTFVAASVVLGVPDAADLLRRIRGRR
jgi:putative peptidoglycan lipid II flippase